jgi:hypothetical protein
MALHNGHVDLGPVRDVRALGHGIGLQYPPFSVSSRSMSQADRSITVWPWLFTTIVIRIIAAHVIVAAAVRIIGKLDFIEMLHDLFNTGSLTEMSTREC